MLRVPIGRTKPFIFADKTNCSCNKQQGKLGSLCKDCMRLVFGPIFVILFLFVIVIILFVFVFLTLLRRRGSNCFTLSCRLVFLRCNGLRYTWFSQDRRRHRFGGPILCGTY